MEVGNSDHVFASIFAESGVEEVDDDGEGEGDGDGCTARVAECADATDDEDYEERERLSKEVAVHRWSARLLKFALTFNGCDPFKIYEQRTSDHTDTMLAENRKSSSTNSERTAWWIVCRRLLLIVCAYLSLKCCSAFILHQSISRLRAFSSQTGSAELCRKLLTLLELIQSYIGDPFSSSSRTATLMYFDNSITCLYNLFVLPYYLCNIQLLDCSFARFLLAPKQEIRRLDLAADEKFQQALLVLERHQRLLVEALRKQRRYAELYDGANKYPLYAQGHYRSDTNELELEALIESPMSFRKAFASSQWRLRNATPTNAVRARWTLMHAHLIRSARQAQIVHRLRKNKQQLRPHLYKSRSHEQSSRIFLQLFLFIVIGNYLFIGGNMLVLHYLAFRARCLELKQMSENSSSFITTNATTNSTPERIGCRMSDAFTPVELLMMGEANLLVFLCLVSSYSFFTILLTFQIRHQLLLTKCTTDELRALLASLRSFNRRRDLRVQPKVRGMLACSARLSSVETIERQRDAIERSLYTAIVHLWNYEVESPPSVRLIAQMLSVFIVNDLFTTITAFSARNSLAVRVSSSGAHESDTLDIVGTIAVSVWMYTNVFLMFSAIIPSRVIAMKRIVMSVSAELVTFYEQTSAISAADTSASRQAAKLTDNPAALLWRRLVLTRAFALNHHPVRVFSLSMTFKKALEVNFYIVSFVSLLTTHRSMWTRASIS